MYEENACYGLALYSEICLNSVIFDLCAQGFEKSLPRKSFDFALFGLNYGLLNPNVFENTYIQLQRHTKLYKPLTN